DDRERPVTVLLEVRVGRGVGDAVVDLDAHRARCPRPGPVLGDVRQTVRHGVVAPDEALVAVLAGRGQHVVGVGQPLGDLHVEVAGVDDGGGGVAVVL